MKITACKAFFFLLIDVRSAAADSPLPNLYHLNAGVAIEPLAISLGCLHLPVQATVDFSIIPLAHSKHGNRLAIGLINHAVFSDFDAKERPTAQRP
jgi:hypothetical protein